VEGGGGSGLGWLVSFAFLVPSTVAKHFIWQQKAFLSKSKRILDFS
jgi:hypothetical protein